MPDEKNILLCRVKIENDLSTNYIYEWAEEIKKEAELLGFKVIELNNEYFEEERIKSMIEKYDPFLVFLNAHGSQYSIKGMDMQKDVILRCKNDHLFKDRIVYALSCSTGVLLGKSAFTKGCKCYIGYRKKVYFPTLEKKTGITEDFVAEPFMKSSNEIILNFLKGKSPEETITNSQKLIDSLITVWENDKRKEAPSIIRFLKKLKRDQVMYAR